MNPNAPRDVRATMNYTVDNGIPPDYYFYEPEPGTKLNPPGTDPQEVLIEDGWPRAEQFHADREGFEIHPFGARFDQFDDDESIQRVFYAQVIEFVKRHTGAQRVEVFDFAALIDPARAVNFALEDGDVVYVPTSTMADIGYALRQLAPAVSILTFGLALGGSSK